jgi:CRISPR type I-E-associated protein CasB/Cse2
MTPTEQFIQTLESLKAGDLGRLRNLAGLPLDESVDGFDLFAGLWWPLRQKNQKAPRREVAWLIAKLYAFRPMSQAPGATMAGQLGKLRVADERARVRHQQRFDELLLLPLSGIEPALQWGLTLIADNGTKLDWVRLTDELSIWDREETRRKWAMEFLGINHSQTL